MFRIKSGQFGQMETIEIRDEKSDTHLQLIPSFGAVINQLVLSLADSSRSYDLLEGCEDDIELMKNDWYKGAQLFPFPNRIENGQYSFNGKTYQLPINFPNEGHAIHGLIYNQTFEVIAREEEEEFAKIELALDQFPVSASFPFTLNYSIEIMLTKSTISIQMFCKNDGEELAPMAWGWHPYFKLGTERVDDLNITLMPCQEIEVDDRMIPTGRISELESLSFPLTDVQLDTGFQTQNGAKAIQLLNPKDHVQLNFDFSDFDYFQLFIPPNRKSIAIEPMTAMTNAFNNEEGLIVLKPNEKWSAEFIVQLSSNHNF